MFDMVETALNVGCITATVDQEVLRREIHNTYCNLISFSLKI